jgi:transposase
MKRRKYSKSFKLEAVRLLEKGDTSATRLANELGVRRNQLYKWQRQDKMTDLAALQRRVAELEEENAILKKAEAYFTHRPK